MPGIMMVYENAWAHRYRPSAWRDDYKLMQLQLEPKLYGGDNTIFLLHGSAKLNVPGWKMAVADASKLADLMRRRPK